MMKTIRLADKIVYTIQEYICLLTGIFITVTIVIAAVMRYILKTNFGGSEELILYFAFWFYFMGSSLSFRDGNHINADMTRMFIKDEKKIRIIKFIRSVLNFCISLLATSWAARFIIWSIGMNPKTTIYRMPLTLSRSAILISFGLATIYLFAQCIVNFQELKEGEKE